MRDDISKILIYIYIYTPCFGIHGHILWEHQHSSGNRQVIPDTDFCGLPTLLELDHFHQLVATNHDTRAEDWVARFGVRFGVR